MEELYGDDFQPPAGTWECVVGMGGWRLSIINQIIRGRWCSRWTTHHVRSHFPKHTPTHTEVLKRKAALEQQEEVLREAAGDALDMFSIEVRTYI